MATRLNPSHDQRTRDKIKTSQLINRLMKHAIAKAPIMDATQIRAAEILLRKVLPDLASTELTGKDGEALLTGVTITLVKADAGKP